MEQRREKAEEGEKWSGGNRCAGQEEEKRNKHEDIQDSEDKTRISNEKKPAGLFIWEGRAFVHVYQRLLGALTLIKFTKSGS